MSYSIDHNCRKEFQLFANLWGIDAQEMMAIEEMSELTKAICDRKRGRGLEDHSDMIEEIADVLITALQLAEFYGYEQVMKIIDFKMCRGLERADKYVNKQEGYSYE